MRTYSMTFKTWLGRWDCVRFEATCDTDARFIARSIYREKLRKGCCGFSMMDFDGNYIDL